MKSTLVRLTACLSSILYFAGCSSQEASSVTCKEGDPGCATSAGGNGTGGSTQGTTSGGASSGGAPAGGGGSAVGGVHSTGGSTANSATSATGGAPFATGGTTAGTGTGGLPGTTGGSTSATGGSTTMSSTGGSTGATGGTTAKSSTSATGGASSAVGGKTSTGGTPATGGAPATGGSAGCAAVDQGNKAVAKRGDRTSVTNDYLNLCDMRLLNNNWGSVAIQKSGKSCTAPESVQVNSDGSLGWTFSRGNCADDGSHPDYPELEYGVGPFGSASSLLTSPAYSSTTLLPIQVKNIQTAIATIDTFAVNLTGGSNFNLNIEFWLSRNNPLTNTDGGVYAEFMGVWGWDPASTWWNCTPALNQSVTSSGKTYNLCHQSDTWGTTWRFFQFEATGGAQRSFTGSVDIKAFLDWFFGSSYVSGATKDLWLTRIELGTEIGDSTSGTCTIKNVTYNINGTSQSPVLAQ